MNTKGEIVLSPVHHMCVYIYIYITFTSCQGLFTYYALCLVHHTVITKVKEETDYNLIAVFTAALNIYPQKFTSRDQNNINIQ